ncbi:MAG: hypothetical protein ACLR4X_05155 [Clostridia bacterium]
MIKYCIKKWNKNNQVLLKELTNRFKDLDDYEYKDFVKLTVEYILNYNSEDIKYNTKNITEINDGDYQGTLLYMIPEETYQPCEYEYLMTFVNYGSCSGCDTLKSIQYGYYEDTNEKIKAYFQLCKDLITNMIKPYNTGWRASEEFEHTEEK